MTPSVIKSLRRRVCIVFAGLLLLFAILVAAAPVWLPWVIRPLAGRFGLEYAEYEREGYSRFVLHGVRIEHEDFHLSAARAEAFQPLVWFYRIITGRTGDTDFIAVTHWRLSRTRAEDVPDADPDAFSPYEFFLQLEKHLPTLTRALPRGSLSGGKIRLNGADADVPRIQLRHGIVEGLAEAELVGRPVQLGLSIDFTDPSDISLTSLLSPYNVALSSAITREDAMLEVKGDVSLDGERMDFFSRFEPRRRLPKTAGINAERLELPGRELTAGRYDRVGGSVDALWERESYEIALSLYGFFDESSPFPFPPPLEADINVRGDLEKASLEKLHVRTPWLTAFLDAPLCFGYRGELLNKEPVAIHSVLELSRQPFFSASGTVRTVFDIAPGDVRTPEITLRTTGEDLSAFGLRGERVSLEAILDWSAADIFSPAQREFIMPDITFDAAASSVHGYGYAIENLETEGRFSPMLLEVENLEALLAGGTAVRGRFDYDMVNEEILRGELDGEIMRRTFARHLPESLGFDRVSVSTEFSGPLRGIDHATELLAGSVYAGGVIPGDVQLRCRGRALQLEEWEMVWENEEKAAISSAGSLAVAVEGGGVVVGLDLQELAFRHGRERILELLEPASVGFGFGMAQNDPEGAGGDWKISASPVILSGPAADLSVGDTVLEPESGRFAVAIEGFGPGFFEKYISPELPDITVNMLHFDGFWEGSGPLNFDLNTDVMVRFGEVEAMFVESALTGREDGIGMDVLTLRDEKGRLLSGEGFLPVSLHPSQWHDPLEIDRQSGMEVRIFSDPAASFWTELGAIAGVRIDSPAFEAVVSGTFDDPRCFISLGIDGIGYAFDSGPPLPDIEDLNLELVIDASGADLKALNFLVEGQKVRAEAFLPFGAEAWESMLRSGELPDWQDSRARLMIEDARLDFLVQLYPELFSTGGKLSADIVWKEGEFAEGYAVVEGTSTRPLLPAGPFTNLLARMTFEGRSINVEELSGEFGGERVRAHGVVGTGSDTATRFRFNLRGANIPLVRQPGFVLRADLDLDVRGSAPETASISGLIRMRESVVVTDWRAIIPQLSPASPRRRPPFFSVEQHPFSGWEIDVGIEGDEFLSARAPAFRGAFSIDMRLRGTLLEPLLTGDLHIESGMVRFPFSSLDVNYGMLSITEDAPFTPQLLVTASSRTYGYDIEMHLHGTAYDPVLEFSSHPPLSSRAILLMLTAGELPRDEIAFTGQQKAAKLAFYIAQNFFTLMGSDGDLTRRLKIRTGEDVSAEGRETYHVEFMLLPRLGVIGEYDRFDEFNLGLKWRFFVR